MVNQFRNLSSKEREVKLLEALYYLLKKWYVVLIVAGVFAAVGFLFKPKAVTTYTATYSFVLSTESKPAGFSSIATQFGLDGGNAGTDNVFTGDNIIELFGSRKMVSSALMRRIDSLNMNLLTLMTTRMYPDKATSVLPYPATIEQFNPAQKRLFERIAVSVAQSSDVYKKDKKLAFYFINGTSTDPVIAFYISKFMLDQTSQFFIETKTKVATKNLELLSHEADSIGTLLGYMFRSTAEVNDRSFNINPSILAQRSGTQLNQAKIQALSTAYAEVMRNLEIAKVTIQKETPLFQVIDEPVLPLDPIRIDKRKIIYVAAALGFVIASILLLFIGLKKSLQKRI